MNNKITILTTTHYKASTSKIPGYPANHNRLYTHTNLIENIIQDLYSKIGCSDLRHIISLDHDENDEGSKIYLQNLKNLEDKYPNIEIITTTKGIYHSIKNLVENTKTPYYLWWEHDWKFIQPMNLNKLIKLMNKNKEINYIRFNKRPNITAGGDTKLWEYKKSKEINLLGTTCWSNNPYFGRVSKMLEWYKMMKNSEEIGEIDARYHPTIEVFLQSKLRDDVNISTEEAEKNWGVFIYGKMNENKRVEHLDGKNK